MRSPYFRLRRCNRKARDLSSVLAYLTIPEFSATMLALMGSSSGAYIRFKLPMRERYDS